MDSQAYPAAPQTPGHRRTKTSILKSIVSPSKTHKKSNSAATAADPRVDMNPLNSYMRNPNIVPQLPALDLDPPVAPFVHEDRKQRMHRKSFSSISLKSFKSRKDKDAMSVPVSPVQSSGGFSDKLRDLASPNRGSQPPSPEKSHKKPTKSKSAIDIGILRRKEKKPAKAGKENEHPRSSGVATMVDVGLGGHPGPALYGEDGNYRMSTDSFGMGLSLDPSPTRPVPQRISTDDGYSRSKFHEDLRPKFNRPEDSSAGQRSPTRQPRSKIPEAVRMDNSSPRSKIPDAVRDSSPSKKLRPKSAYIPSASIFHGGLSITSPRKSVDLRRQQQERVLPDPPAKKLARANSQKSVQSNKSSSSELNRSLENGGIDALNREFEELLISRGVSEPMKDKMRGLDVKVKHDFIQKQRQMASVEAAANAPAPAPAAPTSSSRSLFGRKPRQAKSEKDLSAKASKEADKEAARETKKSRPRSGRFGTSKGKTEASIETPLSPTKTDKCYFPPSTTSAIPRAGPPSPTLIPSYNAEEWVKWLTESARRKNFPNRMFVETEGPAIELEQGMKDVQIPVLHKLRLVLRNESVWWIEGFLKRGGMEAVWGVIERVLGVEWREDHEDQIYHQALLCMKGLCTASLAQQKLAEMSSVIFPRLLESLFDEEHKGPAEFTTRGLIITLLFVHISTSPASKRPLRVRKVLSYLADKKPDSTRRPLEFIEVAHVNRPYKRWTKEVFNVTKEVFWIFLHGANVVPLIPAHTSSLSYSERNFPTERPPVPAAAHVGGVEWDASNYLALHVDLLNGCIASLATREERNDLRNDLQLSGWERAMGGALRTCKEKLHAAVHDGLQTWVRAASEDDWYTGDVRFGPRMNTRSRPASPVKKKVEAPAPQLELGSINDGARKVSMGLSGAWEF